MGVWLRMSVPILEMVTEKYLLRAKAEWCGRKEAIDIFDSILGKLESGDVKVNREINSKEFFRPYPDYNSLGNEFIYRNFNKKVEKKYASDFWGFWMMGGMSGGGMGFIFNP